MKYNHKDIEKKWQKFWEEKNLYAAMDNSNLPKYFCLIEFPYPSGDGLHVGHIRSNTAMDVIARKRRAEGFNVIYPIGYDSFGLPTENYAIKTGAQPQIVTKINTERFRKQLKSLGFSFDWSREIDTSDPNYYKWTQWIFIQMFKKGLAYKSSIAINWCLSCKTGLANEEVVNGRCERCGGEIEKRQKEQWMLAIRKYADRLDHDLDNTDYLEKIKIQQKNWIGRSEGAEIKFKVKSEKSKVTREIEVFTTRPDTLFGVTYVVLAPEHSLVSEFLSVVENKNEIEDYITKTKNISEIDRTDSKKEKTGVELKGIKAINPVNKEEVPVWIADYVLPDYGTGAVMAVPAHDERDFEFAKKFGLNNKQVVVPYFENTTDLIPRKDSQIQERNNIHVILFNPKNNKYLIQKWKSQNWKSFVTGGIENNESLSEAAKREVLEETGYKNIKHIQKITDGWEVHSYFYAPHKDVNRYMKAKALFFELENEDRNEVHSEDKDKYEIVWLDKKEVRDYLSHINQKINWDFSIDSKAYLDQGVLINSEKFNSKKSEEVKKEITTFAGGTWVTKYKLRDWVFSRQRYWGEPIPLIFCNTCGWIPVPEENLPIKLPVVNDYKPTDNGESPLAAILEWVNTTCPKCNGEAKRETDTMPNWAGSSWYYIRYLDPTNNKSLVDKEKAKYWLPVDWYNGGMEHVTLHLLYSRFWHKFLYDIGIVDTNEPYKKRTAHGMILAENGEKMSKSKGNVVSPDDLVEKYGADSLRLYEMFMGPFDQSISWNSDSITGCRRFIEKVYNLREKVLLEVNSTLNHVFETESYIHATIKKVSSDIERMSFNTAISSLMILVNYLDKNKFVGRLQYETLLKLLSPFAPHVTEDLWSKLGNTDSIHSKSWPKFETNKLVLPEKILTIQVNGKIRDHLKLTLDDLSDMKIKEMALSSEKIKKWIDNKKIKKVILIKSKLINFVTE